MLLPPGGGEISDPVVLGMSAARDESSNRSIYCPSHIPPTSESFYECLDESALDEEDSDWVEEHELPTLTFLDLESLLVRFHLSSRLPVNPHSQQVITTPILRC